MNTFRILTLSDIHGNIKATSRLVDQLTSHNITIDLIIIAGDLPATTSLRVMGRYMLKHPFHALSKEKYTQWVYKSKGRDYFIKKQILSIDKVLGLLSTLKSPIIYIPGNVDSFEAIEYIQGWNKGSIHILDSNPFLNLGLTIVGTGGAIKPPSYVVPLCDYEFNEIDYNSKWIDCLNVITQKISEANTKVDILVTHEPPRFEVEINEDIKNSGGSSKVSDIVAQVTPNLVIFGHYHEYSLVKKTKGITYVNPGPLACYYYAIIDYSSEKLEVSLKKLPSSKFDSINKIYSKRTAKNVLFHSLRFV